MDLIDCYFWCDYRLNCFSTLLPVFQTAILLFLLNAYFINRTHLSCIFELDVGAGIDLDGREGGGG